MTKHQDRIDRILDLCDNPTQDSDEFGYPESGDLECDPRSCQCRLNCGPSVSVWFDEIAEWEQIGTLDSVRYGRPQE